MNLIHVRFHHNLLLLFNMFSTFFLVVGIWLLVSKSTDGFHMRTIKTKSATINLSGRLKSLQMSTLNLGTSSSSGTSISTALEIIREKLDAPPETILTTVEKAANYRLSASEASIQTGASISESRRGLMTLATLTGGDLEVTPDGDIIYSYPLNFRRILSQRSLGQKIREFKKKVYPVLYKLIRLSVSAMLFTSLAIVSTTIILAMSSSSKDSDDDSSSSRRSRSRSSSIHINLFDFSTRTSNASYKDQSGEENKIGFFNSFFSFVFGDGNPNQGNIHQSF